MPTWLKKRSKEDDSSGSLMARERRNKTQYTVLVPLLLVLVLIVFSFNTNLIPSRSMEPTLMPGDHVVIMRAWIAYPFGRMPERGDIITFHPPKSAQTDEDSGNGNDNTANAADATTQTDQTDQGPKSLISLPRKPTKEILIKRVIGLPGDMVQVVNGVVTLNGKPFHENYRTQPVSDMMGYNYRYAVYEPLKVPPGHLFVLGDNRSNSDDGRFWGTLDRKDVIGKCVGVLFHEKEIAAETDAEPPGNGQ